MISRMLGNFFAAAIFIAVLGLADYNIILPSFVLLYVLFIVVFGLAIMWFVSWVFGG
jgi:hypothetical protein